MPIDLSTVQPLFTEYFHTNPATVQRPQRTNVNGSITITWLNQPATTCHVGDIPQKDYGLYNDKETAKPAQKRLTLPYAYDLRQSDRVTALGRRWKVINNPIKPQFAMQTVAYVVDVTGEV